MIDWIVAAAVVASGAGVFAVMRAFGDSDADRSRRARRACEEHPVVEAAAAKGRCRIQGRVVILDEVPGYPGVGAFFARSVGTVLVTQTQFRLDDDRVVAERDRAPRTTKKEATGVGRFAVLDGTGAAIVEGVGEIWYIGAPLVQPRQTGAIQIREGMLVDVIGHAEHGSMPAALSSRGSYRGGGTAVRMVGTKKSKVLILAHGLEEEGALQAG